jgi:prevent-host-death family protein
MEINVKEARGKISSLLDRVKDGDEVIILRRGKQAARLVPVQTKEKVLPGLKDFRASISVSGEPVSSLVASQRDEERY